MEKEKQEIKMAWKMSFGSHPKSDWAAIFGGAIVLVIIILAINAWVFYKIDKHEVFEFPALSQEEGESLDLNVLKETVLYYQNKEVEFEKFKAGEGEVVVDPSL